jgi:murein DD-endopeptidase MepM/ murein hydrolase activator NlpD
MKHEVAQEVGAHLIARTPEAEATARFIAEKIKAGSKRGNVNEIELADSITEIEEETQILGANFLKVHVIDPYWELQNSGFVSIDPESGLLDEIEIEFPAGSNRHWVLCAGEGSTQVTEGNFVITFQDKLFADLKAQWTPKFAPAGTQTRAQFIRDLLKEAGVPFVIPGLNIVQEVEPEEKGEAGQKTVETATSKAEQHAAINKLPGPITRASWAESLLQAGSWPVTKTNIQALVGWAVEEGGAGPQFGVANNTANYNPLNTTQSEPGATGNFKSYVSWQQGVEATITTLNNGNYPGIVAALKKGTSAEEVAQAIVRSPWGTTAAVEETIAKAKPEAGGITLPAVAREAKGDVGQLKRGTDSNPDEDSGECIKRLAQQVDWFAFSDGYRFYYMTGPELTRQTPALTVEIPQNRITTRKGVVEEGVILQPSTYTFDQTTFEYQKTHKLRKKTQRRSKATKPSTPSEVKLRLVCEIGQYVAGEAILFKESGPVSSVGRWLIAQTTRKCFKDTYTEIICEPPVQPLPEPKESGKEEVPGAEGGGAGVGAEGYINPFGKIKNLESRRIDQGVDLGGSGPLLALGDGRIYAVIASDPRFENGALIGLTLKNGPYAGKSIYYSEGLTPSVTVGAEVKAGQQIATLNSGGEFGWANGNLPLAESIPGSGNGTTQESCAGASFNRLLLKLGCPGGTKQAGGEHGTMPPGYP